MSRMKKINNKVLNNQNINAYKAIAHKKKQLDMQDGISKIKEVEKAQNQKQTIVLSYSGIEQKRYGIWGINDYFKILLFFFPLIPIVVSLSACVVSMSESVYSYLIIGGEVLLFLVFIICTALWLKDIYTVYMVEDGILYKLRISVFWYRIKNKMYLLNPTGKNIRGRIFRMFYMLSGIKMVLQSVSEEVSIDELIAKGHLKRINEVNNLSVGAKVISFDAVVDDKSGKHSEKIKIKKVYEKVFALSKYLENMEEGGLDKAKDTDFSVRDSALFLIKEKSHAKKAVKFQVVWTGIMLWMLLAVARTDLNLLIGITHEEYVVKTGEIVEGVFENSRNTENSKEYYVKQDDSESYYLKDNYGKSLKAVVIIYLSVSFIYYVWLISDVVFKPGDEDK